jgi:phosphorylase kinase alpha/beta subunit
MMKKYESLQLKDKTDLLSINKFTDDIKIKDEKDWWLWRKNVALVGRSTQKFYKNVWYLLQQCNGLVIGDKYNQNNRIGSELTLDTTAGERNFELRIDSLLQSIEAPDYRQLNIEVLQSLSAIFKENSQIKLDSDLMLDVLIGHAVRLAWSKEHQNENYDEQKSQAWSAFYKLSPHDSEKYFIEAFMFLLTNKEMQ